MDVSINNSFISKFRVLLSYTGSDFTNVFYLLFKDYFELVEKLHFFCSRTSKQKNGTL